MKICPQCAFPNPDGSVKCYRCDRSLQQGAGEHGIPKTEAASPSNRPASTAPTSIHPIGVFVIVLGLLLLMAGLMNNRKGNGAGPAAGSRQELLRGFIPAGGHIYDGTEVYIQGVEGQDTDPPRLEFTVVDPSVRIEGERWMLVRYQDGSTDYVNRETVVLSGMYFVRDGDR